MPQPIGRVPLGLLSLLDSKANGVNPNGLMEDVRGTLDLVDMFGLYKRETLAATVSGGTIQATGWVGSGLSGTMLVPPGQVWRVLSISCDAEVSSGNPGIAVGYADVSSSRRFGLSPISYATTGAGAHVLAAWQGSMWFPPHYVPDLFIAETNVGTLEFLDADVTLLFERYLL
jgi:hypothetical protein